MHGFCCNDVSTKLFCNLLHIMETSTSSITEYQLTFNVCICKYIQHNSKHLNIFTFCTLDQRIFYVVKSNLFKYLRIFDFHVTSH